VDGLVKIFDAHMQREENDMFPAAEQLLGPDDWSAIDAAVNRLRLRRPEEDSVTTVPDSARELISSGRLAHLATVNADGSPQLSVVWVGFDGDEIVTAHMGAWQKVKNLQRDPRVVLSIESDSRNAVGMQHSLTIRGHSRVTEGGAAELLQRLAHVYVGPDAKFPPFDDPPPGYVIHITVDHVGGIGPWNPGSMA
jgi:PPOX class probable F420-dependent enzyme